MIPLVGEVKELKFVKDIVVKTAEEVIKNELVLRPGIYYRKSDNELIMYSSRKKLDKLGRLVLEN